MPIVQSGDVVSLLRPSPSVQSRDILEDIDWLLQARSKGHLVLSFSDPMYTDRPVSELLEIFGDEFDLLAKTLKRTISVFAVPQDFRVRYKGKVTSASFLKQLVRLVNGKNSTRLVGRVLGRGEPYHITEAMNAHSLAHIAFGGSMHYVMLCAQSGVPAYNFHFQEKHTSLSRELYNETVVPDRKTVFNRGSIAAFLHEQLQKTNIRKTQLVASIASRSNRVKETAFRSMMRIK